jgi:hypothetical protein
MIDMQLVSNNYMSHLFIKDIEIIKLPFMCEKKMIFIKIYDNFKGTYHQIFII